MRWIRPGRFLMGSPETEQGRFDQEGPQHEVTFTKSFWLSETPCTQDLWQAVMGENPSDFQSEQRPVDQVSWWDCRSFLEKLNKQVPGLAVSLPTEAQWEYACRAGTQTSTYVGELRLVGANNAPLLDRIAWYAGNSGVDFDLETGWDSRSWKEVQYSHSKAGTRLVRMKVPNAWGLYDMLGNVWEWCLDVWELPSDGEDRKDSPSKKVERVFRGGSWTSMARRVRAAYRSGFPESMRFHTVGFRLAHDA